MRLQRRFYVIRIHDNGPRRKGIFRASMNPAAVALRSEPLALETNFNLMNRANAEMVPVGRGSPRTHAENNSRNNPDIFHICGKPHWPRLIPHTQTSTKWSLEARVARRSDVSSLKFSGRSGLPQRLNIHRAQNKPPRQRHSRFEDAEVLRPKPTNVRGRLPSRAAKSAQCDE